MPRLTLKLFGAFLAELGDQPLQEFKTNKARALLAYLAVENGQAHRRAQLCNLLWPESNEQRARQNLSQTLYNLNKMLGGQESSYLLVHEDSIQFNSSSDHWVDTNVFINLISAWGTHEHTRLSECQACLDRLSQATQLYQGDFMAGFALRGCQDYEEWLRFRGERLREMGLNALYHLAEALRARGDLESALHYSWQLVTMDALWEQAQRQLIGLLANSGRREAALAQYRSYERALLAELGVEPEADTQALYERLREPRQLNASNLLQRHNLPASLTAFVGRDKELEELNRLISDPSCRLLTITGPGGSGKTRLAIEAALSQVRRFRDGAFLVQLGAIDPRQPTADSTVTALSIAFAEALSIPISNRQEATNKIEAFLRDRQLLLVLDGFEQLIKGAHFIADLLKIAPEVKIISTSRVRLNIAGEQHFLLGGMGCPKPEDEYKEVLEHGSVRLFVEAGARVHPGFSLRESDIRSVVRICELVGGLPLGILLAAAWLGTFSTEEIATEIERNLDFLSANWEDIPERQRSLRATFDYSWGLLSQKEQQILAGLSIFRGGFTRQAAERVVQASAADLRNLMDKSLLERRLSGRYFMHELLRQYASDKLAQIPETARAIQERFARYYSKMLVEWGAELEGPRQREILAQIDLEYNNLKTAKRWALKHWDSNEAFQVLGVMRTYHRLGYRHMEGLSICQETERFLTESPQTAEILHVRGELHAWIADYLRLLGRPKDIPEHLKLADNLLEQASSAGLDVRTTLAGLWFIRGQCESALEAQREAFVRSLEIGRELGDTRIVAQSLLKLGVALGRMGKFDEALQYQMESLEYYQGLGDRKSIAQALRYISYNQLSSGEHEISYQTMVSAAEHYRQVSDIAEAGEALRGMGFVLAGSGRFTEGAGFLEQSLPFLRESANLLGLTQATAALGVARMYLRDDTSARALLSEALFLAQQGGFWREYAIALCGFGCVELAAGDNRRAKIYYEKSIARYRNLHYMGELGWALGGLSLALRSMGYRELAWTCLEEGLRIMSQSRAIAPVLTCFPAATLLLIDAGHVEAALEINTHAKTVPAVNNSLWIEHICGVQAALASATLDAETIDAIQESASKLDHATAAARALTALVAAYEQPGASRP